MRNLKRILVAGAMLLGIPGAANAAVRYNFAAPAGAFQLTLPSFVTVNTLFAPAQFDFCQTTEACAGGVQFYPVTQNQISVDEYDAVVFRTPGNNTFHYFADGAFTQFGVYASVLNTVGGPATLSVSDTSAVPEPSTWAMMIGGFGLLGGAMRYRRRRSTVSFATA